MANEKRSKKAKSDSTMKAVEFGLLNEEFPLVIFVALLAVVALVHHARGCLCFAEIMALFFNFDTDYIAIVQKR